MKPIFLDVKKESKSDFISRNKIDVILDTYKEQLFELFLIRNPRLRFVTNEEKAILFEGFLKDFCKGRLVEDCGNWVYFSWSGVLVHYLEDELHQELRTARNRNLITKEEQEKFYNFKIGIAGLSVGSHPALTIAMMGGGGVMKIADPDEVSGSNLNRIREDFTSIGKKKCDLVMQKLYQINPYARIEVYPEGIGVHSIREFLSGLDILVEEMDNLEMKIMIREEAKKMGIPVIMATDNGDGVIIDIERYDLEPNLKIFNGVAGDLSVEEFRNFKPQEMPKLATKIAGPNMAAPKMLESILEVGKSLYSWPQLGDAANLAGSVVAYIIKRMALGEDMKTGKMEVNLDSIFDPAYFEPEAISKRDAQRKDFFKIIGLD